MGTGLASRRLSSSITSAAQLLPADRSSRADQGLARVLRAAVLAATFLALPLHAGSVSPGLPLVVQGLLPPGVWVVSAGGRGEEFGGGGLGVLPIGNRVVATWNQLTPNKLLHPALSPSLRWVCPSKAICKLATPSTSSGNSSSPQTATCWSSARPCPSASPTVPVGHSRRARPSPAALTHSTHDAPSFHLGKMVLNLSRERQRADAESRREERELRAEIERRLRYDLKERAADWAKAPYSTG
jgi:hypothetical protein